MPLPLDHDAADVAFDHLVQACLAGVPMGPRFKPPPEHLDDDQRRERERRYKAEYRARLRTAAVDAAAR